MTCAPNSASSLPQKGPATLLGELKHADTGKRQVDRRAWWAHHERRARNLSKAAGTAEKVLSSLNLASDRFGTRQI